ncbi:MAG: Holliday junction branch migration protein RuvA [Oscillospiraceae bacterium]|jgi:Holliday junction DNA helicase RuvA|nr:Holliday junction branch migration protein RuvA [Oscillospiraceae bacterium]
MFYYLEGTVAILEPNLAVIDCGGVGYACHTTLATLSRLELGKKVRLYTYCNIKEDAFDVFGFHSTSEKRCFELLLSVSGVGPRAALAILSACTPDALAIAVITDDVAALTRAPGVGKKLAQRVILELKDKVSKEAESLKGSGFVPPSQDTPGGRAAEAQAALAVLGYTPGEISGLMRKLDVESMTTEEIIKAALKS